MSYINHLSPLHLEVDIIIIPVSKLKRLRLRTTMGHTEPAVAPGLKARTG